MLYFDYEKMLSNVLVQPNQQQELSLIHKLAHSLHHSLVLLFLDHLD